MMGTTADKLSAIMASKKAMQDSISATGLDVHLGDVLSKWPEDLRHVTISGEVPPYQNYMRYGGRGTSVAHATATAETAPQIETLTMTDDTIAGQYSCQYTFQFSNYLKSISLPSKLRAEKRGSVNPTYAYNGMFRGCSNLSGHVRIDVSEIQPLGTIANNACQNMFLSCTSLDSAELIFNQQLLSTDIVLTAGFGSILDNSGIKDLSVYGFSDIRVSNVDAAFGTSTMWRNCSRLTAITYLDMVNTQKHGSFASNGGNYFCGGTSTKKVYFPQLSSQSNGNATYSSIVLGSPFGPMASTLEDIYMPKCQWLAKGSFNGLTCNVHLAAQYQEKISQCDGYADNFTWTRGDGSQKNGNVTLIFDL